ncbi:4-hydroxy-tetrahydrodipicolinate synthase [Bacillus sp. FJAT-49711]|uniref:4-hydroxy-tetrahydrodipicolinate synthase n=1 Tax=Bacillus sp. FJAT-49711 TaxID=2833585 RepID=UPI001BC8DC83|nr:4-hydroxy-tetrahydrodipicolinate synthase [Bacillus sp. FJAT-49711]MBS4217695.1 4-hydroxy-tetrahydrodipicolinate synthase [Bacillus sp. FJAT-49711]
MVRFGRVSTAMVTPFDSKGNIDFQKTSKLVNHLINNGSDSLVVSGTTGESPTLSTEEKLALFRHILHAADGKVPVIAGTGSNNTYASIELTKKAEEIGVDAIMLVAPYYNKPSQSGLYQHFVSIARSTSLPVMIYNIPGRSSVNIAPETMIELSKVDNIVAAKEASGDLNAMADIISSTDDDFLLYSGDDSLALPVMAIGGYGVVSVASHIIGPELQEMIRLFEAGNHQEAAFMHRRLLPLMRGLFTAPSPTPVKTALQMTGFDVGSVRLPLIPLTEQERFVLANLIDEIK